jgi:hypothetical protein
VQEYVGSGDWLTVYPERAKSCAAAAAEGASVTEDATAGDAAGGVGVGVGVHAQAADVSMARAAMRVTFMGRDPTKDRAWLTRANARSMPS